MEQNFSLNVREIEERDISLLANYWYLSDDDFLTRMGVDLKKMPTREDFSEMIQKQIKTPVEKKVAYALIWEVDMIPVGHSNINKITYGTEAYMHLHIWKSGLRKKGLGPQLVIKSLPFYFQRFELKNLICEPRAINPGPNKTLEKVGFELERTYVTIPGSINFEQEVNCWKMSRSRFNDMYDPS